MMGKQLARILESLDIRALGRPMLWSALVGLVAGLGAIAFFYGTNAIESLVLHHWGNFHLPPEGVSEEAYNSFAITDLQMDTRWFFFLLPLLGGAVSGWLVFRYAPEAEGHGTDAVVESFHRKNGLIRPRVPIIKTIASMATIGTGGSAGREGPIAQIGAGFGSYLAGRLGLDAEQRHILLIAGIAGGIGAIFRAPLGGALFAVEVLYQEPEFEHEGLIPAIISSITAYTLFGAVTGWQPLLATPLFTFQHPPELLIFLVMGVVCALVGKLFVAVFYGLRDRMAKWPVPATLRPVCGAFLLGLLAMWVPYVLGSGYGLIQAALYGKMAMWVMVVIMLAKILATSFTISSGGSGGVFAPSLVIGAMLGGAFGLGAEQLLPALVADPRAYVLVGMAGFFAGVSNTPIATLIMVSELTGDYGLLAPLMLVTVVAMVVFRRNTIYEKQVPSRADSPAHLGDFVIDVMECLTVGDLAEHGRKPSFIPADLDLHEILNRMAIAEGAYYPVVDDEQRLIGIFSVNDIRRILHEDLPPSLILAQDIANSNVITATLDEPVSTVLRKLTGRGLEEIPIVDPRNPQKVLFMLSRRSVLARYANELERWRGKKQTQEAEV